MTPSRTPSPVRVDAFLADDLALDEGKLQIVGGGWTNLLVRELPARRARIGLAILLRVPILEHESTHGVTIRLEDPDGRPLPLGAGDAAATQLEGEVTAWPPSPDTPLVEDVVPIAIAIDNLVFEQMGAYRFVIGVDGVDAKLVPFAVLPAEE